MLVGSGRLALLTTRLGLGPTVSGRGLLVLRVREFGVLGLEPLWLRGFRV